MFAAAAVAASVASAVLLFPFVVLLSVHFGLNRIFDASLVRSLCTEGAPAVGCWDGTLGLGERG